MYAVKFLIFVVILAIAFAKSEKKDPVKTSELVEKKSSSSSSKKSSTKSGAMTALSKLTVKAEEQTDKRDMLMEFLRVSAASVERFYFMSGGI